MEPVVSTLARLSCPVAIVGSHYPLGLYSVLAANVATYALVGLVKEIHVVKSLSPQLDEAALKAVRSWKFKLIEGDPDGPKDYQVEISFRATCTPRS